MAVAKVAAYAAPAVAVAPVAVASHAVVPAAVLSNHIVKHYDVPSSGSIMPTTIDVPANVLPVNFVFRSASSAINVQQAHQGSAGSFKETASQDEPHVLKHTVTKPIIQEVREVISPFRKITQTVEPVREQIETLVARGVGATQGALLAANMAARPAVMAAPLAAPLAVAAPAPVALAAPAIASYAAPMAAAVAAPAIASYGAALAGPAMALDAGLAGTYKAGFLSAAPVAMPVDYASPYGLAKKL